MRDSNKFLLAWGLHCGTRLSRDLGDEYEFETEQELRDKWKELKEQHTKIGHQVWFASMKRPGSPGFEKIEDGETYS
jgi:hypothetical protein